MDVKKRLIDLKGKQYLPVAARIVAFRETHPAGAITTELISTEPRIIVRASIHAGDGVLLASGYGTAPTKGAGSWTGREVEKSETAAIGRALAHAGFGTLYATDANDDDTDNLADAPIERPRSGNTQPASSVQPTPPSAPQSPPAANGWTRQEADSLITEANTLHVTTDELLGLLGVERISQYAPGFSEAREALKRYIKARPADATPPPADLFGGNGGAA